tara:strand:- start:41 stop:196 length:156 start_codon:yes stop_codon:yes gene_type:complete
MIDFLSHPRFIISCFLIFSFAFIYLPDKMKVHAKGIGMLLLAILYALWITS